MPKAIDVRGISPEQVLDLRQRVLRPQQPAEASRYPNDDHPETRCFGLFQDGALVAICSYHADPHPKLDLPVRLRGVAVEPALQGQGLGRILLQASLEQIKSLGYAGVWCNARTPALTFYDRLGFGFWGGEFELPDIGPHVVAYLRF